MHTISLPDPLYAEAERAASASGLSVEAYIREAVEFRLVEEAPIRLTPEQAAIIAEAEADIDAGNGLPIEQLREDLLANRKAWRAAHPGSS